MSDPIEDGGPAFPETVSRDSSRTRVQLSDSCAYIASIGGMTLRAYAAIKLRVPESGIDWLDDMIRKSLRDSFAATVLPNYLEEAMGDVTLQRVGEAAYETSDAALKARKGES